MENAEKNNAVDSPCVNVCTLDEDDVCLGCGRTLREITRWTLVDDRERRVIVLRARQRKASRQRTGF